MTTASAVPVPAPAPAPTLRRWVTAVVAAMCLLLGTVTLTTGRAHAAIPNPYPLGQGYWLAASDGGIFSFGSSQFWGSTGSIRLNKPVVGMAPFPYLEGYWFVASDGGVFSFGSADFWGSTGSIRLNQPVVGMAAHPSGLGYWLVAKDGGIFTFGAATFKGSHGGSPVLAPIVGMAASPTGAGYWIVGADGSVSNYGVASFGGLGGIPLNKPIVGMAATPTGLGYWLVASDGGVFAFGDAQPFGSEGGTRLNQPIVGMTATPTGQGYWLVASDGGVFSHGDAVFKGSTGSIRLNQPVVGIGAKPPLAVRADAYNVAGSFWDNTTVPGDEQLSLTPPGGPSPAGARILGVEGLAVSQLGTIKFKLTSGACTTSLAFVLVVDTNGDGTGDTTRNYPCTSGVVSAGPTYSFTPTTFAPPLTSSSQVTALDIVSSSGTVRVDNIFAAGITVSDHRTFTATGPQAG